MYLLDTNVISELRKAGDRNADANVMAWFDGLDAGTFYLSVITLMELEHGILLIERRDTPQATRLRGWMQNHVLPEFSKRTLPVDAPVALRCARLHVPDRRPERDALIAATALVHGMMLVTRNLADFQPIGVPLTGDENEQADLERSRFQSLPISARHGQVAGGLTQSHRDPFDRLLVAPSQVEGLTIITADSAFIQFGVPLIWASARI